MKIIGIFSGCLSYSGYCSKLVTHHVVVAFNMTMNICFVTNGHGVHCLIDAVHVIYLLQKVFLSNSFGFGYFDRNA